MISVAVSVYLSMEPSFTAIVSMLFCDGACESIVNVASVLLPSVLMSSTSLQQLWLFPMAWNLFFVNYQVVQSLTLLIL